MLRTTLRSLWSHKRRLISTCVSVLLGVAFMAATFVLSGTISSSFDALFDDAYATTDATVRGETVFESDFGDQRAALPEELVEEVRGIEGVDRAEPYASTFTLTLLDADGDPVGGSGAPTVVSSWVADDELNVYALADGRAPEAPGEVVINESAAEDAGYEVGDDVELVTADGRVSMELVGTASFGEAASAAGSIDVFTTLEQVQELSGRPGLIDSVEVTAADGLSEQQLVDAIRDADVIGDAEVVTATQASEELSDSVTSAFGEITRFLVAFALISLFVGAFIISNTFGILVAQRTKELALLRAVGATRRQVLVSVLVEAGIIGLISSLLGLAAGVGLAAVAMALLGAAGLDLPDVPLAVEGSTIAYALLAGIGITAVAAFMPAVRATRVAPIAALRDVAIDNAGSSRLRAALGIVALLLGLLLIAPAFGSDVPSDALAGIGIGMALVALSVLVLGPVLARPLSRLVGAPLPRLRGVTGRLARENAMRNPRRTASTASAIIIGVTLVGFITIFASSVQRSVEVTVDQGFRGDFILQPINQFSLTGVSPSLAGDLAAVDGVEAVTASPVVQGELTRPDGSASAELVQGIEPDTFPSIFEVDMAEGSLADLGPTDAALNQEWADNRDLAIGDSFTLRTASGEGTFTVRALTADATLLQPVAITRDAANELVAQPTDFLLGLSVEQGTDIDDIRPALDAVTDEYPTIGIEDRQEYTDGIAGGIQSALNLIYGLLGVSVLIALIGIANTLSLSIHERTRELGLLRAMGMSRSQVRASIRWEAVIVALLGTSVGLLLGLGLSWVLVQGLSSTGITEYQVPVTPLVSIVVGATVLGVLASLLPARRASRLNVLQAIATE